MTTITFRAPAIISAGSRVEEFNSAVERDLDAETTELNAGTFTVRVADEDARAVKNAARPYGFQVVSEE